MAITHYTLEIEFDVDDMDGDIYDSPEEISAYLKDEIKSRFAADNVKISVVEEDDEDDED